MKLPRYFVYFLSGIIPYLIVKQFEKKFLDENEIEQIKNPLELRGGNFSYKFKSILDWLKHVLKSDLAARVGLTGFIIALIYNEFNDEVILALSKIKIGNNIFSNRLFIFSKLKEMKAIKLSKEILEILKSDALQSMKEVAISKNLTFSDKFVLLRIKLESLLKSPLCKGKKRLNLIIALLALLWLLIMNGTEGYAAFLFALRNIINSTDLLQELKDFKLEESPFDIDQIFDEALTKFEDKFEDKVLENVQEKVLVEVFKYCPIEMEDVVFK